MLELYLKLYEARSVNFEACGNAHGIGRDEVLGAAAAAAAASTLLPPCCSSRSAACAAGGRSAMRCAASTWAR